MLIQEMLHSILVTSPLPCPLPVCPPRLLLVGFALLGWERVEVGSPPPGLGCAAASLSVPPHAAEIMSRMKGLHWCLGREALCWGPAALWGLTSDWISPGLSVKEL